ncbi:multiple sugar transport system ATP-binding protein [Geodermatophilus normandii]|uniref:Multiple sugar transport system ATP-binding protein n=1 Tax=Geodermatophilus normandii TaxID=1137989 RepID=A0A317QQG0_9ACTN|nr:sn-glycerol-3-phosphate ABC transporter ATP-binding protein UgpC [Geodermatophilus normandii]PWW24405.1 multiple sugar transport system ATP-binding protein [Geodermatophilus normandii]
MASITYDRITKRYPDGTQAVSELDLAIADGEFLVLVGPSGCGKTTALRMAAGLEEISDGRLLVGDRVVNEVHPSQRDIAMVFQNYALYPHMSVRENIAFPLACAGVSKEETKERVARAAEALGLTDLLHRKPKALSGGQRQRVAMGRAIVRQPQAFLMDEPLSNLDAKLRGQMRAEIRSLQREYRTTTLYVTHDQVEAMTMGDRIAVLRKGLLQQLGTPDELYESPANLFVAEFIGSPPMNVMSATVTRTGAGHELVLGSQRLALPAGTLDAYPALAGAHATPVALGLRPEALRDPATADPSWPRLLADVELVENLPPEKLVHLRVDAEPVVTEATLEIAADIDQAAAEDLRALGRGSVLHARLAGTTAVREGTRAQFAVPPSALHFFDLSTGQAIAPRSPRLAAATA